ncbi:uncharacterized protein LOC110455273 isoform X2 [Mizuhopecten yessoensis]|uniref:uncharacterized protein LOC110455273 isoform X2 n=1 Tax=Mizuhopecten yessoensis TaxID=6573 RepID=UPI000B45E919|nr:uncharacterized protein LOC110455273 isoform X2 [Mizuhopecten yessoensis]
MAEDGAEVTVLDSWEELDDSRIMNKKLEEIKISNQDDKKMTGSLVLENQDRTQYQPQVRILKRRSDPGATASSQQDASDQDLPGKNATYRTSIYRSIHDPGYDVCPVFAPEEAMETTEVYNDVLSFLEILKTLAIQ